MEFVDRSEECAGCPLLDSRYVAGHGLRDCPVFVVGAAPGAEEEKTGRAFSGPTGRIVKTILEDMGVKAFYSNVLPRRPKGKKPSKSECFRCSLHLIQEMKFNQVEYVLALGSVPFGFLQGDGRLRVGGVHGLTLPMSRFGLEFKVTPTYDPGYVTRQGGLESKVGHDWLADLEDFAREVRHAA